MANDFISKYVKRPSKKNGVMQPRSGNSWLANAMKSVGYSTFDILTDLMPASIDVAKTTATVGKDIATSFNNARTSSRNLKTSLDKNFYVGLGRDIFKNSLEDLKSGKFYNKDRTQQLFDSMNDDFDMGDMGFDDVDFGDEDFDVDEFDDTVESSDGLTQATFKRKKGRSNEVTSINVNTDMGPDSTIVKATEFQTETVINVGKGIVANSQAQTKATLTMVGTLRNELNSVLSSIDSNVSTITSVVSESLGRHDTLSAKYYEDSINLQTQILTTLQDMKGSMGSDKINTRQFKEYNNVLDIFTSGGALDPKAYWELVKKQGSNYVDNNMFLSQMKFMNDNRDSMQMIAASPFQKMLENSIKSLIPGAMQSAMTAFDNQLKETMVAGLNQVSGLQRSNNPLLSAIGQIFGLQNKVTLSSVDKSAYNKGAMSWTGTDHQALTNVIPTLLRKIYASVSGTQEIGFDYEQGKFRTVRDMENEAEANKTRRETSGFGDYKSGFKDFLSNNFAASREERDQYSQDFEKFISKVVRDSAGGRTFRLGGRDGKQKNQNGDTLDDIRDLLGAGTSDDKSVQLIRSYFKFLEGTDKASVTRFFGNQVQEQRATIDKTIKEMQEDPTKFNAMYMNTGLEGAHKTDSHLKFENKNNKNDVTGVRSGIAAGVMDIYGKTQNDYLREILRTLSIGIYVVPIGGLRGGDSSIDNDTVLRAIQGNRGKQFKDRRDEKDKEDRQKRDNRLRASTYTDDKRQRDIDNGKLDINGDYDTNQLTTHAIANAAETRASEQNDQTKKTFISRLMERVPQDSGAGRLLGRLNNRRNQLNEKGVGLINKGSNALFDLVFGTGEDKEGSFLSRALGSIKSGFTGLTKSIFGKIDEKILKPLDEKLFGDDGFFTKIKESEFGKALSAKYDKFKNFLLGDLDGDGNRSGGLFSETFNSLKGMGTVVKEGILGKKGPDGKPLPIDEDSSVLGNMKRIFRDASNNIKDSLGLDSIEPIGTRLSNSVDKAFSRITDRAHDWTNTIFGRTDENGNEINNVFNSEFAKQFKEDMKGQKGFIGASASVGLLSSFFLPGGPIGGALLGAGVGIISKSTGLKDFLFGPEDENGERIGGLINKQVQGFFKDNKTGLGVGAGLGLASSFGLLPSFFLPGGPIGGALIGGAVSLLAKSDAFDSLLYGPGGTKDDPTGGIAKKFKEIFGKDKTMGNVGVDAGIGAGVGILGSFFLPGGPILGALLGSATSIATGTDKFRNWFFGEEGEDGKRQGGVFSKFTDFTKEKIFTPLSNSVKSVQLSMGKFVEKNMILPFKFAMDPLLEEAKHTKDVVKEKFTQMFDGIKEKFHNRVTKPIGDTVDKYLISPLKKTLNNLFSGLGKIIGAVISAPFKAVGALGWGAYDKQKARGREDYIQNSGRGFLGRLGMRLGLVDREGVNAAQYSDKGASYEAGQEIERRQRYKNAQAEIDAKYARKQAEIKGGVNTTSNNISNNANIDNTSGNRQGFFSRIFGRNKSDNSDTIVNTNISTNAPDKEKRKNLKNIYKKMSENGFTNDQIRQFMDKNYSGDESDTKVSTTSQSNKSNKKSKNKNSSISTDRNKVQDDSSDTKVNNISNESSSNNSKITDKFKPKGSKSTKDTGVMISSIEKDVAKIRDSVEGQLNGVGSNVNKIYKLLLKNFGSKDEDIQGDNNKDYVGFFGKLKGAFKHPLKTIEGLVSAPFKKIADLGKSFIGKIGGIGKALGNAGKALVINIGKIGKGIGKLALEIVKLPIDLVRTGLKGIRTMLPAVGKLLTASVELLGDGLKIAGSVLVTGVKSVGNIIAESSKGLGKILAGALGGLGNILGALGIVGADVIKGAWSGAKFLGKGAIKVAKFAGNTAINVGKSLGGGALNLAGNVVNKLRGKKSKSGSIQRVYVEGGTLDLLKRLIYIGKKPEDADDIIPPHGDGDKNPPNPPSGSPIGPHDDNNPPMGATDNGNPPPPPPPGGSGIRGTIDNAKTRVKNKFDQAKQDFKDIRDGAKSKFDEAKQLASDKLKESKLKERTTQVANGSREAILSRLNQRDKDKQENSFKEKLLGLVQRNTDAAEGHHSSFFNVFDLKKGVITAGVLMMLPAIIKLFKKFDLGGLFTSIANGISTGFQEIGGMLGLINNAKEKKDEVEDVINGTDTHVAVDENGELIYDENGNLQKETVERSRLGTLLTPTKTRIDTETGKWENNQVWTDRSDAISMVASHQVVKGARTVEKGINVGKKVGGVASKVFNYAIDNNETLGNAYIYADDAIKAGKKAIAGKATATFESAKGLVGKVATKVTESDGVIGKAIGFMNKALDFLVSKFGELGTKYGTKITEGVLGKVLKSVRGILNPQKLSGYADEIGKFLMKITGKTSAAAATLALAEIGFALYGAIDGAANAGALFEVNPKDVNAKMRAIASIFRALLSTSIGSWIDLVNSLVYEILGYNFVKTVATHVYKLLSGDKADAAIDEAQKQFTADYEAYVASEYQAYVDDCNENGRTPMSEEEFKASELSTTRSEYNSKTNKSLSKRVVDAFQGAGKGLKNAGKTVVNTASNIGSSITNGAKFVGSKIGNVASGAVTKVKDFGGNVIEKGKEVFGKAGSAIGNVAKEGVTAVKAIGSGFVNIYNAFNDPNNDFMGYFKSDVNNLDENNPFHGLVSGILNVSKFVMFPKLVVFGIFKKIGKAIAGVATKVFDGVKKASNDYNQNVANLNQIALAGDLQGLSKYDIQTSDDNPISGFTKFMAGISRLVHYPVALVALGGKKLASGITSVISTVKKASGDFTTNVASINQIALSGDLKGLTDYQVDISDDNPIGGFTKFVVGASRLVHYPVALIALGGKKLASGITSVISTVKTVGGQVGTGSVDMVKLALSGDMDGLHGYQGVDEEGNPIGGFVNGVYSVEKIMLTPLAAVTSVGKKISSFIKTGIGTVIDYGSTTVGFVKKLNTYTDPDKDLSGWDKETMAKNDDDIVGTVISTIVKKVMYLYVGVVRTIKNAFGWVGDLVDGAKDLIGGAKEGAGNLVDKAGNFINKIGTNIMNLGRNPGGGSDGGRPIVGGKGDSTKVNGEPYFSQNDPKYKNMQYAQVGNGTDTFGNSGCGPTAMAMVASKIKGNEYDPKSMAKMAEAGGYNTKQGTTPGYFNAAASALGIPSTQMSPSSDAIQQSISSGNPVILQGRNTGVNNSPFTNEGHYVNITGIDGDKFIVNDPRGKKYSGSYYIKDTLKDATSMWSFAGKGGSDKGNTFTAQDVIDVAKSEIGYEEKASSKDLYSAHGNAGSNNHTKYEKDVFGSSGNYWCASFVCWCFYVAANRDKDKAKSVLGTLSMACETLRNRFIKDKRYTTSNPQPGDCIFFKGTRHSGANHIGIVVSVSGNKVTTVEGNTSSKQFNDNGGVVASHTYDMNNSKILGYGRPAFDGTSSFSGVSSTGDSSMSGDASATVDNKPASFTEALSGAAQAFSDGIMEGLGFKTSSSDSGVSTSSGSVSSDMSKLTGNSVAEKIWNYFTGNGYSKAATAAILGNAEQESSLNPADGKGKGPAYGIFQWESNRYQNLQNLAKTMGKNWYDIEPQIAHLANELPDSKYAYFSKTAKYGSNVGHGAAGKTNFEVAGTTPTTYNAWRNSTDVDQATRQFEAAVERASWPRMDNRIKYAKKWYNALGSGKGGTTGGKPITSSESMGNSETLEPLIGGKGNSTTKSVKPASSRMQSIKDHNIIKSNNKFNNNSLSVGEISQLLKSAVEYLSSIADNTNSTSDGIKDLNGKDFGSYSANNIVNNTNNNNSYNTKSEASAADRSNYDMAKRVAAGLLS